LVLLGFLARWEERIGGARIKPAAQRTALLHLSPKGPVTSFPAQLFAHPFSFLLRSPWKERTELTDQRPCLWYTRLFAKNRGREIALPCPIFSAPTHRTQGRS
jgi:hypothetical protein